ncbi:MAG: carboxypeptidase-like regulatory domain-containing protein, partial [Bacteroidetes bacterium]|nr:carboxypeptidase-like regulatory domain-containing protein [Bacteroidota bacterium]
MMTHRSKLFKFFLVGIIIAGIGACEKDKIEVKEYGKLSGLVLDAQTNIPIPTANISTNPASTTVLTDSEGKFFLDEVPSGDVVINAQKDKFITGSVKVAVYPNKTTDVIIMLESSDPSQSVVEFSDPDPPNEAVDQYRTLTLSWRVMDNAGYDSLRFDVLLFESPGMEHKVVASDIKDTSAIVDFLFYGKTYYWQVVAKVEDTEVNRSSVWTFSTLPFPDVPFFYA